MASPILPLLGLVWITAAAPAMAGKLDLDVYSRTTSAQTTPVHEFQRERIYLPGDPRALRGESLWVRRASYLGYTSMGIIGSAGSIGTGNVAPAVGFGIVALINSWMLFFDRAAPNPAFQPTGAASQRYR